MEVNKNISKKENLFSSYQNKYEIPTCLKKIAERKETEKKSWGSSLARPMIVDCQSRNSLLRVLNSMDPGSNPGCLAISYFNNIEFTYKIT